MPKPLLLQSPLTDSFYIVTRYTHKTPPNGKPYFVAHTQYDTTAQVQSYIEKATTPLRQELAEAHERIRVLEGLVGWSKTETLILDDLIMHAKDFSAECGLKDEEAYAGCWATVAAALQDLKAKRAALATANERPVVADTLGLSPAVRVHSFEDCPDRQPGDVVDGSIGRKSPPNFCAKCFFRLRSPQPWLYVQKKGDTHDPS